ncbi:hypothetical protein NFI96_013796, partial [Prochilodus magdalenae]
MSFCLTPQESVAPLCEQILLHCKCFESIDYTMLLVIENLLNDNLTLGKRCNVFHSWAPIAWLKLWLPDEGYKEESCWFTVCDLVPCTQELVPSTDFKDFRRCYL